VQRARRTYAGQDQERERERERGREREGGLRGGGWRERERALLGTELRNFRRVTKFVSDRHAVFACQPQVSFDTY